MCDNLAKPLLLDLTDLIRADPEGLQALRDLIDLNERRFRAWPLSGLLEGSNTEGPNRKFRQLLCSSIPTRREQI